jgi:hypothetical protein
MVYVLNLGCVVAVNRDRQMVKLTDTEIIDVYRECVSYLATR